MFTLCIHSEYGFAEKVVEGMSVRINSITIKVQSRAFHASFELWQLQGNSLNPKWQRSDLRYTRVTDPKRGEVQCSSSASFNTALSVQCPTEYIVLLQKQFRLIRPAVNHLIKPIVLVFISCGDYIEMNNLSDWGLVIHLKRNASVAFSVSVSKKNICLATLLILITY